jgi:hypothetical protein
MSGRPDGFLTPALDCDRALRDQVGEQRSHLLHRRLHVSRQIRDGGGALAQDQELADHRVRLDRVIAGFCAHHNNGQQVEDLTIGGRRSWAWLAPGRLVIGNHRGHPTGDLGRGATYLLLRSFVMDARHMR